MATRTMNETLARCKTPTDQDVVRGLLASLFAGAGPSFAAKKLEERLADQDMCDVFLLQAVTVEVLEHPCAAQAVAYTACTCSVAGAHTNRVALPPVLSPASLT
jgi:hypothetical protein